MPFDSTVKALVGEDARTPLPWARDLFCQWVEIKLNTEPYASGLGLTESRRAYAKPIGEVVAALYEKADSPPVVVLMQGPADSQIWRKQFNGVLYEGERIEVQWTLDMGINDATPDDDNVAAQYRDESRLVGYVREIVRKGYNELNGLGLLNVDLTSDAEKQRAGQLRNPHALTFFLRILPDYEPVTP